MFTTRQKIAMDVIFTIFAVMFVFGITEPVQGQYAPYVYVKNATVQQCFSNSGTFYYGWGGGENVDYLEITQMGAWGGQETTRIYTFNELEGVRPMNFREPSQWSHIQIGVFINDELDHMVVFPQVYNPCWWYPLVYNF